MRAPPASRPGGWARLPQGNVGNGRRRRSGGRSSGMPWHGSAIPRGRGANSTNWASSSPNSHAVHGARLSAVVLVSGAKWGCLIRRDSGRDGLHAGRSFRSVRCFTCLPSRSSFRDLRQVVGQNPPPNPPTHPPLAMVAAALQPIIPPQHVDPPFDSGAEPITAPEPPLLLLLPPCG